MAESFDAVLAAAIDDLLAQGFDSQERVDRWLRRLREAARNAMVSPESLEQRLRDGLAARYRKYVEGGELLKLNPGVDRFTIDKIKPSLRIELDRRIMASAELIKLNREEAIERTLKRFQGWSTSIPRGGVSAESTRTVKKNVRKSLASLPFEERRVLIDQGHKLIASISEIVATDGGAIAVMWRSHYRQAGYNYREDHKERDGQVYLVRDSWVQQGGLAKKGGNPYYDEIESFGQLPFCRCYGVWIYNLRDLPAEMLTAKGRQSLEAARARADDAGGVSGRKLTSKAEAGYSPVWSNKQTRCCRCSMFLQVGAATAGNACTAVEGDVNAVGHCGLFEVLHRNDSAAPEPAPGIGFEAHRRRLERLAAAAGYQR